MRVKIQPLRPAESITQSLRSDGWKLEFDLGDLLVVCHPQVPSEADARERLGRLGLLTSREVRIEFEHEQGHR